jgi:hypothetical protein
MSIAVFNISLLPQGKAIERGVFQYCSGLTTVTLGDGLEEIGACAFGWCTLLEEIVIPNAVKMIEYSAFGGCSGLMTVTLGYGLEEIGACAFEDCILLEQIAIPNAFCVIYLL